jgi:hypothetical protein
MDTDPPPPERREEPAGTGLLLALARHRRRHRRVVLGGGRSSRSSLRIFASFAASSPRSPVAANGIRRALQNDIGPTRGSSPRGTPRPRRSSSPLEVSEAQSDAARRYAAAVRASSRIAPDAPLDPATRDLVTSTIPEIRRVLA